MNPNTPNAHKYEQAILQKLASVGQRHAASLLSVDESTISRIKSEGRLSLITQLLDAVGLKVVSQEKQCYDPEYIESLRKFAQRGLQVPPQELDWEE